MMNIILLVIGVLLLIYGIKVKTKYFSIIGIVIICLGLISFVMDYRNGAGFFDNSRVPVVIENTVK